MTTMSTVIITRNNGTVITATSTGVDTGPLGLVLPDGDGHTAWNYKKEVSIYVSSVETMKLLKMKVVHTLHDIQERRHSCS